MEEWGLHHSRVLIRLLQHKVAEVARGLVLHALERLVVEAWRKRGGKALSADAGSTGAAWHSLRDALTSLTRFASTPSLWLKPSKLS